MGEPRGLFGSLISPTKIKGDSSAIDEEQATMLSKLASGDISGSLTGGDRLIALGALLKSVSRGSKTSPQEVLQNLQQSKLQEMQTKIQLGQLQADAARKARIKAILPGGATGATPGAAPANLMPEDYYALADRLLAEGDIEGAKIMQAQGAGLAQYTPSGRIGNEFAAATAKAAYDPVEGIGADNRPFKMPRWKADGAPSPLAWIQSQSTGGVAPVGAPPAGAPPAGAPSNLPSGSPLNPVPGAYTTGLSKGEEGNITARTAAFQNLLTDAQATAMAAQQRLPQVQAMDALSQSIATGKTAEWSNAAKGWLNAFGLSNDPAAQAAVANAAAFTDLRKRNTLTMLQSQKGASSDKDMQFAASVGPLMTNTPAGNRLISATEAALLRRDVNFNNFLGRYQGDPGMALEAWGKTRQGRLGIMGDPDFVKSAVATGAIKLGQGVDKRTNKKVYFVQTKNGQRIFLN
jgi:hypothetical protein